MCSDIFLKNREGFAMGLEDLRHGTDMMCNYAEITQNCGTSLRRGVFFISSPSMKRSENWRPRALLIASPLSEFGKAV